MTTTATIIALSVAMIALVGVMVTLAYLGQRARQAAPYVIEIEAAEAKLRVLREEIDAARRQLDDERKNVDAAARIAAEVAALTEQRDSVLAEIANMGAQREELGAIERERTDLVQRHGEVSRDLREAEAQLAAAQDRIEKARIAESRLADLQQQAAELERRREDLESEVADLRALVAERDRLGQTIEDAQLRLGRLGALAEGEEARLSEAQRERERAQAALQDVEAALFRERDGLATVRTELVVRRQALAEAEEAVTALLARRAQLGQEIEELERKRPGSSAAVDGLADLKSPPALLQPLRTEAMAGPAQEAEALHRTADHLRAAGLVYPDRVLKAFHTALKVNDHTQMTVLAGISGTGKSQLPRRYAEAMGLGFLPVPVQPRWDSPQDLMGFYNYIEGRYRATDLARCMWQMDRYREGADSVLGDRVLLVLLDEMNLARVEYYFSDFLSRLETRPPRADEDRPEARRDAEIVLDVPQAAGRARIFPGRNILFAGTMNEDESTQSLSDKVVDRANVLRFASPTRAAPALVGHLQPAPAPLSRDRWNAWHRTSGDLPPAERDQAAGLIEALAQRMAAAGRPIGHRLRAAMLEYVANYPLHQGERLDVRVPLADQVEMRLLPKLRGVETELHEPHLNDVAAFAERDLADNVLAEAVRVSLERSTGLGQFTWAGVARAA